MIKPTTDKNSHNHNHNNEAELLERFAQGDEAAFEIIIGRYKNGLYAFLRRFINNKDVIEDIFQETFLQLFTSRESFDTSRPLRPWLFTIAANKAKDALRKQQRNAAMTIGSSIEDEQMSFEDVLNTIASDKVVPIDSLEKDEVSAQVREVIVNMPENLREILILAYFNKFSYKQMAEVLSIPIGTVKSRLHTAIYRFTQDWKSSIGGRKNK
jgi:RNA polymerase sigma-70 factor (ECF subfamily)